MMQRNEESDKQDGEFTLESYGERYSDELLSLIYSTDPRKIEKQFPTFSRCHQILYALSAFVGQVGNGGISQFCFNCKPVVQTAVLDAMQQLGADEMLKRAQPIINNRESNQTLQLMREEAESWDDFTEFCEEMGDETDAFDNWFFDGQKTQLDKLMRQFVIQNKESYVRICDGNTRLERQWTRRILRPLLREFDEYVREERKQTGCDFYDLLFLSAARDPFSEDRTERNKIAGSIAKKCFPTIRNVYRNPDRATYMEQPIPELHLNGKSWFKSYPPVVISYSEDKSNMPWLVAANF